MDALIYGKDTTEGIVSIEVEDDKATLFIERNNELIQKSVENRYWILLPESNGGGAKLAGSLYYSRGIQYSDKKQWNQQLTALRKRQKDFFTTYESRESLCIKDGYTYFKGLKHTDPSILSFDIESTGLYHNADSKVLLISNTFRRAGQLTRKLFAYDDYASQKDMIDDWCKWVREVNPALLVGHNVYTFDLPYLNYVAEQNDTTLTLGRNGSALTIAQRPSKFRVDGSRDQEYHKCRVYGREIIDTYFLAIKHDVAAKKYESYGLKSIIKTEGLEKEDRVHYDGSQIRFNYTNPTEWKKIKEYCEHDADDSLALYDLMAAPLFYSTQSCPKTFQAMLESATGGQINAIMVRSYLQEGHSIPKASPIKPFQGAISLGRPGIYKNCIKWDVSSLYPSIMRQCKVYDEDKDPKGNLLKLLEFFAVERLKNKKIAKETGDPYYKNLEQSQKIFANSMYGFLSTEGISFNFPEGAEFITRTGREILVTAIEWATGNKYEE